MTMRNLLRSISRNQEGGSAVEFALIAPAFLLVMFGTIGLCFALFLVGSLHFAVEDGARCASVKAACQVNGVPDATATQNYTQNHYFGPNVSPTFKYTAAACGNSVSASVSYSMNVGFKTFVIPVSATACFP
jgi:Flp pilus assembly protein TadG